MNPFRGGMGRLNIVPDTFIDVDVLVGLELGTTRGQGHTTHQMKTAPKDATFIWVNGDLYYPKALAKHLERDDLDIKTRVWLNSTRRHGTPHDHPVVIDHACFAKPVPEYIL